MGGPADDAGGSGRSPQNVAARAEAGATSAGQSKSASRDPAGDGSPAEIDLVAINDHIGEVVRVGGLVASLRADGFDLDDGTSVERVVVRGPAVAVAATIVPDDAVALIGRIERLDDGIAAVAVDDPAGIILAGDPTADTPNALAAVGSAADPSGQLAATVPAVVAGLAEPAIPGVGAAGIVVIGLASLGVTLLRRHRTRRRIAARIARRLDELVGTAGTQAAGGAAFGAPSIAALTSPTPTAGPPTRPGEVP
jgi:hypothetical protein